MSEMKGVFQGLWQTNRRNLNLVMIWILWIALVLLTYSNPPQTYIASMASLGSALFALVVWLSYTVGQKFSGRIAALFWLHLKRKWTFVSSMAVFCFLWGVVLILVGTALALILNVVYQGQLFKETLDLTKGLFALLMLLGILPSAVGLGLLFQNITIFSKRVTIAGLLFIVLLGIISSYVQKNWSFFGYIKWLLPPVGASLAPLSMATNVKWAALGVLWLWHTLYALTLLWLNIKWMKYKGILEIC